MPEDTQFETSFIPIGATVRGALMVAGEVWPADIPVWNCSHHHEDVTEALACAEDELKNRLDGARPSPSKDL
jgi:hypothetical protein